MDATAVRSSAPAVTPQGASGTTAAAATTNQGSSSAPTAGGGPTPAPTQPALLGTVLLPAPAGKPVTIKLPDGSVLVPLTAVDGAGTRTELTGGAGSMPLATTSKAFGGGGAAAAPVTTAAPSPPVAPAAPAVAVAPAAASPQSANAFEPKGFYYNNKYYKKYADAGGIKLDDMKAVEERVVKATFTHLLHEEPEVEDFGVKDVRIRRADPVKDADLFKINPRAHYIIDVDGFEGNGKPKSVPSVMNSDGATFVDPRLTGR